MSASAMATTRAPTIGALVERAVRDLAAAGTANARLDARLLAEEVLGLDHAALILRAGEPAGPAIEPRLAGLIARRLTGEPVSRILGQREFWGREFTLGPSVLDPRPDTETLVAAALEASSGRGGDPLRILDLGTGSGVILITLLAECPLATGIGTDIDPAALDVAQANAARHGVEARAEFRLADWTGGIAGDFDLVVSNPPYIETAALAGLSREVRDHDPIRSLDGGTDGLNAYRTIAAGALALVERRFGRLLVEIGAGQAEAVFGLLEAAGWQIDRHGGAKRDLGGRDRVVEAHVRVDADR